MTYSDKLRDPRWQRKRLEIFQRDNWTCLSCHGKDAELNVHHVVYRKIDPWAYPDYLYQTLCSDCHEKRQELTDKAVDALRMAIMNVPTERLKIVSQRLCAEALEEIPLSNVNEVCMPKCLPKS